MTQEVQKRIEQIRRGEVPEGYKKTKVGIIPMDWETTRFKRKFDRLMRRNAIGNTNVLTISAQFGLVNQEEFFNKSVASDDKSNYFLLYRGEYAYNKSYSNGYPFGAIKRLDNYEKGVVSPLYICFSASEKNECPKFYLQYFEAGKMNSEIQAVAQEGARNHGLLNISIDDFFNSILVVPPLPEQEKIAEILIAQDRIIELYEKKIKQLKKLKNVYLQKMFPKHGYTVPEWRFPGFSDAWEQRKFGDIFEEYSEKGHPELPALTIIQGGGTIRRDESDRSLQYDRASLANYKMVNEGDFIVHLRSFEGGLEKATTLGIISPAYHTFHGEGIDTRFYYPYFRSPKFIDQDLKPHVYGIRDGRSIDIDAMKTIEIPWTCIKEQKAIGDNFDCLDNLITLHLRKLDEEKQKKKTLMQLLLTGIVRVK